jgi:hypothetical protein
MLGRSLTVLLGLTAARAAPAQTTLSDPMVGQARLTFNKGGSFKIASFHDLHFGEVRPHTHLMICNCSWTGN